MAFLDPVSGTVVVKPAADPALFAVPAAPPEGLGDLATEVTRFLGTAGLFLGLALLAAPVAVLGLVHARCDIFFCGCLFRHVSFFGMQRLHLRKLIKTYKRAMATLYHGFSYSELLMHFVGYFSS